MAKKKFGKFVALATISGVIAAGISYFVKYKSFHDELDEDFHDFEGGEDFDGELPHSAETANRTYVSLNEKKSEAADAIKDAARDTADAVKETAEIVADQAVDMADALKDNIKDAAKETSDMVKDITDSAKEAVMDAADDISTTIEEDSPADL